jgi:hypothetical protein
MARVKEREPKELETLAATPATSISPETGPERPRQPEPAAGETPNVPVAVEARVVEAAKAVEAGDSAAGRSAEPYPSAAATSVSPLDLPSEVFEAGLVRRKRNRAAIMEWIRTALVEGADYGRIHTASRERCAYAKRGETSLCPTPGHWSKPSLFKPGAEKICGMLGVTVHFPNLNAYEQAALAGQPLTAIILRCELKDGQGRTVAEGIGARTLQQDYGDINKSLKMAGKSAHIDATLRMAGLSEVFTQDLEDMAFGTDLRGQAAQEKAPKPAKSEAEERMNAEKQSSLFDEPYGAGPRPAQVSGAQVNYLEDRIKGLGLERERVLRWVTAASKDKIHAFGEMSPEIYDRVVAKLDEWARPGGSPNR